MSSIATTLGLQASINPLSPTPQLSPYFAIFHFLFAYVFLSTRPIKMRLGLDHNSNPRQDVVKYGESAVKSGKITSDQLNFIQRNEACHANSVEHFPMFLGSVLFGTFAGVAPETVNWVCVWYTGARVVYAAAYLLIRRGRLTQIRSVAWWVGNVTCMYLLWQSGKRLNLH